MTPIVAAALLMTLIACVPMKELSSYSESGAPESASTPGVAQAQDGGPMASAPMNPTTLQEQNPADAPLEPTSATPSLTPALSEPVFADAAATLAPALDAAEQCAMAGGLSISATNSCYLVGETTFSWQDARDACQAWGGDLAQIDTAEESAQLAERIDTFAWIGANDSREEGTFRWVGGEPLEYMGWAMGQPNNLQGLEDCAVLGSLDGRWSDVPCTDDVARLALCERAP